MTADEVVAALGKPRSDNRAFGGGIGYAGLRVMFDPSGKEIWSVTIEGDTRLAGGVGVGDPLAKVKAEFSGGNMVYDNYDVTAGQYALSFRVASGAVDRIVIRPSGRRFADFAPHREGRAGGPGGSAHRAGWAMDRPEKRPVLRDFLGRPLSHRCGWAGQRGPVGRRARFLRCPVRVEPRPSDPFRRSQGDRVLLEQRRWLPELFRISPRLALRRANPAPP